RVGRASRPRTRQVQLVSLNGGIHTSGHYQRVLRGELIGLAVAALRLCEVALRRVHVAQRSVANIQRRIGFRQPPEILFRVLVPTGRPGGISQGGEGEPILGIDSEDSAIYRNRFLSLSPLH